MVWKCGNLPGADEIYSLSHIRYKVGNFLEFAFGMINDVMIC